MFLDVDQIVAQKSSRRRVKTLQGMPERPLAPLGLGLRIGVLADPLCPWRANDVQCSGTAPRHCRAEENGPQP